jgi:hypothetical protein
LALSIAPRSMLALLGGAGGDSGRAPRLVLRVLGIRHVAQALAERRYGRDAVRIGAYVDGIHALSGLGFGCRDRRWRRAALTDAAITTGFALVGRRVAAAPDGIARTNAP